MWGVTLALLIVILGILVCWLTGCCDVTWMGVKGTTRCGISCAMCFGVLYMALTVFAAVYHTAMK